jgi:ornithine--oxo-acid transaminase
MLTIQPGEHGSTYGGNPLACAVGMKALEVLKEERLAEKAAILGDYFREQVRALQSPHIQLIRGKGLLNAIVIQHTNPEAAWIFCLELMEHGMLAKPTHGDKIRFAPPLVITKEQLDECIAILAKSLSILD